MPPVTVPVKKTPKISDLIKDPEPRQEFSSAMPAETVPAKEEVVRQPSVGMVSEESEMPSVSTEEGAEGQMESVAASADSAVDSSSDLSSNSAVVSAADSSSDIPSSSEKELVVDERFKEAWGIMFELLFREIATIYYPLKGVIPSIHHNVIQVKVKNEMMKDNFESRVRLALEYLRNNYDPRIDDIQVEIETNQEQTSKLIYDTQDKLNDLKKENPDLPEFLKILNLSAKDM